MKQTKKNFQANYFKPYQTQFKGVVFLLQSSEQDTSLQSVKTDRFVNSHAVISRIQRTFFVYLGPYYYYYRSQIYVLAARSRVAHNFLAARSGVKFHLIATVRIN